MSTKDIDAKHDADPDQTLTAIAELKAAKVGAGETALEVHGTVFFKDNHQYRSQLRFPIADGAYELVKIENPDMTHPLFHVAGESFECSPTAEGEAHNPLVVEKTDHPDIVGGVVWADCELDWIRAYGTRCYNHGNAKGMEAGRLLFASEVCDGKTATVTREMIGAAHDVMLAKGDFVLSAALLERIYLAMEAAR